MVIYKITNKVNGKVYIGQTVQKPETRWKDHLGNAKKNTHRPLYHAINLYGADSFMFEVIDHASSIEELNKKEGFYIQSLNSANHDLGYNLMSGGDNKLHSPSTKEKISESLRTQWLNNEARSKQVSDQFKGVPKTAAQKIKMIDSLLRRYRRPFRAYKAIINNDGVQKGDLIGCFDNQKTAAKSLKVSISSISCCLNKALPHALGYIYEYNNPQVILTKSKYDKPFKVYKAILEGAVFKNIGEYVGEWNSTVLASQELNLSRKEIRDCLGKKRLMTKGFVFIFSDEPQNVPSTMPCKPFDVYHANMRGKKLISVGKHHSSWMNQSLCEKTLKLSKGSVSRCLKTNKTAGGFVFKYKDLNHK